MAPLLSEPRSLGTRWPCTSLFLMMTCAAQQIGASAVVLLLLKTLHWGPEALSSLWALVGTMMLVLLPLFGAVSDTVASFVVAPNDAVVPKSHDGESSDVDSTGGDKRSEAVCANLHDSADDGDDSCHRDEKAHENRVSSLFPLQRREGFLVVVSLAASVCFLGVWLSTTIATKTEAVARAYDVAQDVAAASMRNLTSAAADHSSSSTTGVVMAIVALTAAQSLQNAVINGWLVDAAKVAGLNAVDIQSWAMTRRSTGSLVGAVVETILFGLKIVSEPASMMLLCVVLQFCTAVAILMVVVVDDNTDGDFMDFPSGTKVTNSAQRVTRLFNRFVRRLPMFVVRKVSSITLIIRRRPAILLAFLQCVMEVIATRFGLLRGLLVATSPSSLSAVRHRARSHQATAILFLALAIVFALSSTPSPGAAYYSFLAQNLQFPNWMLALNGTVGLTAALLSVKTFRDAFFASADEQESAHCTVSNDGQTFRDAFFASADEQESAHCTVSNDGQRHSHDAVHRSSSPLNGEIRNDDINEHNDGHHSVASFSASDMIFNEPLRRSLLLASIISSLSMLSNLVLIVARSWLGATGSAVYMLMDEAVVAFAGRWAYMPLLVIGARVAAEENGEEDRRCCPLGPVVDAEEMDGTSNVADVGVVVDEHYVSPQRFCSSRKRRSSSVPQNDHACSDRLSLPPEEQPRTSSFPASPTPAAQLPSPVSSAFVFELFAVASSCGGIVSNLFSSFLMHWIMPPVASNGGSLTSRGGSSSSASSSVEPRASSESSSVEHNFTILVVSCVAIRVAMVLVVLLMLRSLRC
ncbi:GPI-anchored surface protein, putative [Bodo saltans]|uniref:GPI-anchored surface protein, putative n=1 Tax=Bodo saltans TaxID=75058 RepID=A0A0S4JXP0_BODSA|nr:GPI-anchored surface protein, putative [Bodo saltans]|eukprot:CUG93915.1 GPI-anchored surface protein, putative [Bodo saltans]